MFNGDILGGYFSRALDNLQDRKALTVSQVVGTAVSAVHQALQGQKVRLSQIGHMDIIANAGTVGRFIISAEYFNVLAPAGCRIQYQRNQMGLGIMIFSDFAIRVGTGCVKIAQANMLQPVSGPVILQDFFDHAFGLAIRIDGVLRMALINRCIFRVAVSSTRRRKNNILNIMRHNGMQQLNGVAQIVFIILQRVLH